jgi:DegV family protein with EDD domain
MTASVVLVTDSTAYLPAEVAAANDIQVVPVQVVIGGVTYEEGVDITPGGVAAALKAYTPVSTSRPTPQRFMDIYRAAAEAGAIAVVSAHLSADMSGTGESAILAAREAPIPVTVVDSRSIGMGLGFAVLSGAKAAREGADAASVAEVVQRRAVAASAFFYVDTLEYLRRGGRIRAAQALVGSALMVKPLLSLVDGRVAPLERVRTSARALARLEELAVAKALEGACDIAVHHLDASARAEALASRLRERLPDADIVISEVGAVVGAHVGPGMVAVVVAPR